MKRAFSWMDTAIAALMLGWVGVASLGMYSISGNFAEFLEVLWALPWLTRVFLSPAVFIVLPCIALLAFAGVCAGSREALFTLLGTSVAVVPFFVVFLVAMYLPMFLQDGAAPP